MGRRSDTRLGDSSVVLIRSAFTHHPQGPNRHIMRAIPVIVLLLGLASISSLSAQEGDLEKQIQNPVASLISLPFQNNIDTGIGEFDRTRNTLNIQPVLPFPIGSASLIVRTIIPIITQPIGEVDSKTGLGDINLSLFVTPGQPGKVIYAVGLATGIPTATDAVLGTKKLSVGPSFLIMVQPGKWTIGGLVQNTWSVAGDEERDDVNLLFSQIFVTKNLSNGWYLNTAPIITANWEADSDDRWTVPLGLGAGKLSRFGSTPVNIQLGAYNYVVSPDAGPDWQFRAQVTLLFPK